MIRLRHLGKLRNGAGFPVDLQGDPTQEIAFFKVKHLKTHGLGVSIVDTDDTVSEETAKALGATVFPPGTIVFAKIGAALLLARFSMIGRAACIDNNMAAFIPNGRLVDPRYILPTLSQIDMTAMVQPGAVPSLRTEAFYSHAIPVPDLLTQKAIAEFLDRENAHIEQLIHKKQRMVEVLEERFASVVEQMTTPHAGNGAQLVPFKWICRVTEGQVDPTDPDWAHAPLIAPNHIQSGTGRILRLETVEEQGVISGKYAYSAGTVLYSKIRPALAKACVAPQQGLCSADMYPILTDNTLIPEFLLMQLLSRRFTDWATLESMRVAMPKINRETLGRYCFWVPCRKAQARLISQFTTDRMRIEKSIDAVKTSLDRLHKFRSALITAAVTGQIDVSTWSKQGTTDRRLDRIEEATNT